jgi:DNA-binding winged helix-turn-helix (wHTH) protein
VPLPRYRFGSFLVSPAHRVLRQDDRDVPLIPRYFDLLVLLLAERHRAVTRQEIFDRVWGDVVVSDGALSQAIRTIRRCLGDDPREPRFLRTVARHGYQFVWPDVVEVNDDGPLSSTASGQATPAQAGPQPDPIVFVEPATPTNGLVPLLDRLLRRPPFDQATDEERREAAEQLLALDAQETLRRLDGVSGDAEARAILRDVRWDVPGVSEVRLLDAPHPLASIAHVVRLRLRRAAHHISNRWAAASAGGALAGTLAGSAGGLALWLVPESQATPNVVVALALVGAVAGALGAAGIGAGLAMAEALARSARTVALTLAGAAAGALSGALAHGLARAVLSGVFGRDLPAIAGGSEGLILGAAAGLGYALSTSGLAGGGLATPRGGARLRTVAVTGAMCAVAAVLLALAGRQLVASTLDSMASAFDGSDVGLAPLAHLLGEQELRPMTRTVVSAFEGLMFGAGLAFGLTHRPRRS